jgi:hypothetical protein
MQLAAHHLVAAQDLSRRVGDAVPLQGRALRVAALFQSGLP